MDWWKARLDPLLLAILARGPRHGYAVIADLRERSDGRFDLPEGTVYPALHRLERDGLVTSTVALDQGRRRRTYAITAAGEAALAEQRSGFAGFVAGFRAVLDG